MVTSPLMPEPLVQQLAMAGRLARDLPGYLRRPLSVEQARAQVRQRLASREASFWTMVERLIYARPSSPYARLLRHVGCELDDLRALVATDGIEGALRHLADRGVYVTFDELKGRREIVRGSFRLPVHESDFDNPLVAPHYVLYTGGSRGSPSRVFRSLGHLAEMAAMSALTFDAHGLRAPSHVFWQTAPANRMLIVGMIGQPTLAWFYPLTPLPPMVRAGALGLRLIGMAGGYRIPSPAYRDFDDAAWVAAWLHARASTRRQIVVSTTPSASARIAIAAIDAGTPLTHVTFSALGEPLTEARHRQIVESGAGVIGGYGAMEVSTLGFSCATPASADDMHFFHDRYAMVEQTRELTSGGPTISAMLFTTLTATVPKICFNTDVGDSATVTQRVGDCCALGRLGFTTHLSEVRSFEKLTGEGMTFARTGLEQIIETMLPARFGGTSIDYQLVEEEAADTSTRLVLRISPSVGPVDEEGAKLALLGELQRDGGIDQYVADVWQRAGTLVVRRERPQATRTGKVLPFQLGKYAGGATRPS